MARPRLYCIPDVHGVPGYLRRQQKRLKGIDIAFMELPGDASDPRVLLDSMALELASRGRIDIERILAPDKEVAKDVVRKLKSENDAVISLAESVIVSRSRLIGMDPAYLVQFHRKAKYPIVRIDSLPLIEMGIRSFDAIQENPGKWGADLEVQSAKAATTLILDREAHMSQEIRKYLQILGRLGLIRPSVILVTGAAHAFMFKLALGDEVDFVVTGIRDAEASLRLAMQNLMRAAGASRKETVESSEELEEEQEQAFQKVLEHLRMNGNTLDEVDKCLLKWRVAWLCMLYFGMLDKEPNDEILGRITHDFCDAVFDLKINVIPQVSGIEVCLKGDDGKRTSTIQNGVCEFNSVRRGKTYSLGILQENKPAIWTDFGAFRPEMSLDLSFLFGRGLGSEPRRS